MNREKTKQALMKAQFAIVFDGPEDQSALEYTAEFQMVIDAIDRGKSDEEVRLIATDLCKECFIRD